MNAKRVKKTAARGRRGRIGRVRRWLLRFVLVAVFVCLLPLALTLVYMPAWVHPVSTLMLADTLTGAGYERRWTPLGEMGTLVVDSVVMSEDGQFCRHRGIDWGEFRVVLEGALAGEQVRGASTIPMQTVKNLFLWSSRSHIRKAIELPLALYLDFVLSKKRIMEIYLNIAEWGPGIYGLETAALHHFGKPSGDLTRRQAALLAVTLPNPIERDPASPTAGLDRLAATIERRAHGAKEYVTCLR